MRLPASHTERIALIDDVIPLRFHTIRRTTRLYPSQERPAYQHSNHRPSTETPLSSDLTPRTSAPNEGLKLEDCLPQLRLPKDGALSSRSSKVLGYAFASVWLAVFEYKIIMATFLKDFEFKNTGAKFETQFSSNLQPYVMGQKLEGIRVPLIVKDLHQ